MSFFYLLVVMKIYQEFRKTQYCDQSQYLDFLLLGITYYYYWEWSVIRSLDPPKKCGIFGIYFPIF